MTELFSTDYPEAIALNCVMNPTGSFIYKDSYDVLYEYTWITLSNGSIRMDRTISDPRLYGTTSKPVFDGSYYVLTGKITKQTLVFSINSDKTLTLTDSSNISETIGPIRYRGPCIPKYVDNFCYHIDSAIVDDLEFDIEEIGTNITSGDITSGDITSGDITSGNSTGITPNPPAMFSTVLDTFSAGNISSDADNGPTRRLLSSPYGTATISGGELIWQQSGGLDVNPAVLTWDILDVTQYGAQREIAVELPVLVAGFGARIYFNCNSDFTDGWLLEIPANNLPKLISITGGVESVVNTGSETTTGSGTTYVQIILDSAVVRCAIIDDSTSPEGSIIYETSLGNKVNNSKVAVGLLGSGGNSSTCTRFETSINLWTLLDTFYAPASPGTLATDGDFTDDGIARIPIAGDIRYDAVTGIGIVWANDGSATSPAILSYGPLQIIYTSIRTVVKELASAAVRIYVNCDATFENGWVVRISATMIEVIRIDATIETPIDFVNWSGGDNSVSEAWLNITNVAGYIDITAVGLSSGAVDGDSATLSVDMAFTYINQDVYGIGLESGASSAQVTYFRFLN